MTINNYIIIPKSFWLYLNLLDEKMISYLLKFIFDYYFLNIQPDYNQFENSEEYKLWFNKLVNLINTYNNLN